MADNKHPQEWTDEELLKYFMEEGAYMPQRLRNMLVNLILQDEIDKE